MPVVKSWANVIEGIVLAAKGHSQGILHAYIVTFHILNHICLGTFSNSTNSHIKVDLICMLLYNYFLPKPL